MIRLYPLAPSLFGSGRFRLNSAEILLPNCPKVFYSFFSFGKMAPSKNSEAVSEDGCGENAQAEDIEWLASLSEHELDFLISLKDLAATRARTLGHKGLIQKFNLKVLRALAFVLLEYFKDRLGNTLAGTPADELLGSLSNCGLLDLNCDGNVDTITSASKSSTKDVSFVSSRRKRMWDGIQESTSSSNKKQKTTEEAQIGRTVVDFME